MDSSRRGFFKRLSAFSVALGFGSSLNAKEEISSSNDHQSFSITVKTKYFFPAGKTPMDVKRDLDSWNDGNQFRNLYKLLADQGKVSLIMDSSFKRDHLESRMYFRDLQSYNEFKEALANGNTINRSRQKELGYRIVVEVV